MIYIGQSQVAMDLSVCRLQWNQSVDKDLDGYNVYLSHSGAEGTFNKVNPFPLTDTEYITPPLRNDTEYYFFITAIDVFGNESPPTESVRFITKDYRDGSEPVIVQRAKDIPLAPKTVYVDVPVAQDFMTILTLGGTT